MASGDSPSIPFALMGMLNPTMMGALVAPIIVDPDQRADVIDAVTEYLVRDEHIQRVIVETYDPETNDIPTAATYEPRELATFLVARFAARLGIPF